MSAASFLLQPAASPWNHSTWMQSLVSFPRRCQLACTYRTTYHISNAPKTYTMAITWSRHISFQKRWPSIRTYIIALCYTDNHSCVGNRGGKRVNVQLFPSQSLRILEVGLKLMRTATQGCTTETSMRNVCMCVRARHLLITGVWINYYVNNRAS
jgi:hypothetical protein